MPVVTRQMKRNQDALALKSENTFRTFKQSIGMGFTHEFAKEILSKMKWLDANLTDGSLSSVTKRTEIILDVFQQMSSKLKHTNIEPKFTMMAKAFWFKGFQILIDLEDHACDMDVQTIAQFRIALLKTYPALRVFIQQSTDVKNDVEKMVELMEHNLNKKNKRTNEQMKAIADLIKKHNYFSTIPNNLIQLHHRFHI